MLWPVSMVSEVESRGRLAVSVLLRSGVEVLQQLMRQLSGPVGDLLGRSSALSR